jgi:hypothetical protein
LGGRLVYKLKVFLGLSKNPKPKRHPNTLWREESKEVKDFMKVENGSVHYRRYDGYCTQ